MELLEPVSELGAVKPELYAKILGAQAIESVLENPNIVLGEE
jgi:hypothetical protein